jgi:hypothetical protein
VNTRRPHANGVDVAGRLEAFRAQLISNAIARLASDSSLYLLVNIVVAYSQPLLQM